MTDFYVVYMSFLSLLGIVFSFVFFFKLVPSPIKTNGFNVTLATGSVTSGAVNFGVFYVFGK